MKPSSLVLLANAVLCATSASAADATRPVDYTQRNTPFGPTGSVTPDLKKPATNEAVQEKHFEKELKGKVPAAVGDRRAPMAISEAQAKQVRGKDSYRPEAVERPASTIQHRAAKISTAEDITRPPLVAKYQDSLVAASATNMARFPAIGKATSAKINRFVFRKNPPDTAAALQGAKVIPAAGGSHVPK